MRIKRTIIFIILAWILLVAASLLWNYENARGELERTAFRAAKSFFNQIEITRLWNARHGGLYAPVTGETRPNPYLDGPMRDIEVNADLKLTKINPSFMTRQISEIAREQNGVQFHITSLDPVRPQNRPTPREEKFLQEFAEGAKEKGLFIKEGDQTAYFYMAPLITQKSCLECHARQGYREGDVRGGISVTMPFVVENSFFPIFMGHILIGLVGLFGIVLGGLRLNKAYETIKRQAVFDALTGVPNRRSFSESILVEYKRSQRDNVPLSIIMCDVDNFKDYNDTYGHVSGDECLRKVAQKVNAALQRPSDFCARYGGEEFVVLLPNTPLEGAMGIAETIRSNIEAMAIAHKNCLPAKIVTISLGVATSEGASLISYEGLIKHADQALYRAKEQGRNQVQAFMPEV